MTLAEAMASGKPVVATRYSGNLDFMEDGNSFLVDCSLQAVGEPDLQDASRLMRMVFDRQEVVRERVQSARASIDRDHSPAVRARFVNDRIREICGSR